MRQTRQAEACEDEKVRQGREAAEARMQSVSTRGKPQGGGLAPVLYLSANREQLKGWNVLPRQVGA